MSIDLCAAIRAFTFRFCRTGFSILTKCISHLIIMPQCFHRYHLPAQFRITYGTVYHLIIGACRITGSRYFVFPDCCLRCMSERSGHPCVLFDLCHCLRVRKIFSASLAGPVRAVSGMLTVCLLCSSLRQAVGNRHLHRDSGYRLIVGSVCRCIDQFDRIVPQLYRLFGIRKGEAFRQCHILKCLSADKLRVFRLCIGRDCLADRHGHAGHRGRCLSVVLSRSGDNTVVILRRSGVFACGNCIACACSVFNDRAALIAVFRVGIPLIGQDISVSVFRRNSQYIIGRITVGQAQISRIYSDGRSNGRDQRECRRNGHISRGHGKLVVHDGHSVAIYIGHGQTVQRIPVCRGRGQCDDIVLIGAFRTG